MAYVPDWERLSDVLKRVMAAGSSEDDAKLDITRTIADKKIRPRLTVVIEPDALMNWHRMVQSAQGFGSPQVWERLSDALARFTAIGSDEAQAKVNICRVIANREIKIRFRVEREEGGASFEEHVAGTVRLGDEVEIPPDLNPKDFNWQQSRPLNPWRHARQPDSAQAGLWHIEWIELLLSGGNDNTECFEGANVQVPPHLTPGSFDWEKSRPVKPWSVRLRGGRLGEWRSFSHPALLIELSVFDVRNMLCGARTSAITKTKKPKRGRPPDYNWAGVKARLETYASENGAVESLNELLQKCADFASELHPRGSTPDDKTIREAIKTHALEIAAGLAPGKSPGK